MSAPASQKDPFYERALKLVKSQPGGATTSWLQGELRCGWARAVALMNRLAEEGKLPKAQAPIAPKDHVEAAVGAHESRKAQIALRAEHKALADEVTSLRQKLDIVGQLKNPLPVPTWKHPKQGFGDAMPIGVASDWHVEEPVDPAKVHGLNEYNLEIAEERAKHFFQNYLKLCQIIARDCQVNECGLLWLGDFFTNFLHEENRETNLLPPAKATLFAQKLLTAGVKYLLANSDFRFSIWELPGNHGRMTLKPRKQNVNETSLEWYMYQAVNSRFEDEERVSFTCAPGKMLYIDLFETYRLRILHGDDVTYQGGVGGLTIPLLKKINAWDKAKRADLTVLGHHHRYLPGPSYLGNGSLIGYNEYAQAIGADFEEPRQAFFSVHARNGGTTSLMAPIWLDGKHHEAHVSVR